jgi:LmbE family N-acetylglucosaminyl deacetylase
LHRDHVVVREAALAIARARSIPVALYAELPYAVQFGWPSWVTGASPRDYLVPEARWQADLVTASVRWEDLVPRVTTLSDEEVRRKADAMRVYRTQFAALNSGPLGRLEHPEVIPFEVHWDILA